MECPAGDIDPVGHHGTGIARPMSRSRSCLESQGGLRSLPARIGLQRMAEAAGWETGPGHRQNQSWTSCVKGGEISPSRENVGDRRELVSPSLYLQGRGPARINLRLQLAWRAKWRYTGSGSHGPSPESRASAEVPETPALFGDLVAGRVRVDGLLLRILRQFPSAIRCQAGHRNQRNMSADDSNENIHVEPQQHSQLHLGGNDLHPQMVQPQQTQQQQPGMTVVPPQGDLSSRKCG